MTDKEEILKIRYELKSLESKYLIDNGWEVDVSRTLPINSWIYTKEYKGKTLIVNRETALELEFYHLEKEG